MPTTSCSVRWQNANAPKRPCAKVKRATPSRRAAQTMVFGTGTSTATKSSTRRAGRQCSAIQNPPSEVAPTNGLAAYTPTTWQRCAPNCRHIWKVAVSSGEETKITSGETSVAEFRLSRDGAHIAFQRVPSGLLGDAFRGALRIEWAVLDWNARAMSFYDRLGARRPHEWIKHALEGEELARVASRGVS